MSRENIGACRSASPGYPAEPEPLRVSAASAAGIPSREELAATVSAAEAAMKVCSEFHGGCACQNEGGSGYIGERCLERFAIARKAMVVAAQVIEAACGGDNSVGSVEDESTTRRDAPNTQSPLRDAPLSVQGDLEALAWRPMTTAPQDGKTQIVARHAPNEHTPHGWIATITMDPDDPDEHRRSGLDTIVHYNGDALLRGFHGMWTGWMYPEEFAALASAPAVTAPPAGTSESPSDWARFRPNLGFRTPEPSIREIVRRYYALHLSPVKASELADRYIAAVASRPQTKEAGASDA